ncbi:MAG: matrixin family metalloprotease [Acidobacteriota bacterium]
MKLIALALTLSLLPTSLFAEAGTSIACFAEHTSREKVARVQDSERGTSLGVGHRYNVVSNTWDETATDGSGLAQGDPITITWSVVPDGTTIDAAYPNEGEVTSGSDLRAFLNGIYGDEATWLALFQQAFDRWTELSGVTYVYESNDDGALVDSNSDEGVLGVRGDVRISGHSIDGSGGILAYNYYPGSGADMVIDTDDTNNYSNELKFRNIIAHELGHGLGMKHVCPVNKTKLMEPFLTTQFDGPQYDDILAANRLFGDVLEANDTPGTATSLGSIVGNATTLDLVSIDDDSDPDFYSFTVDGYSPLNVTVTPNGSTYLSGTQNNDGSCSAGSSYNATATQDLEFNILDSNGSTVLQAVDATSAGGVETLSDYSLSAGTYYLEVAGFDNDAQLYDLEINAGSTDVFAFGRETIDENTRTVSLSGISNARVVMGPLSFEGADPATVRLANVSDSSFQHRVQEWDYLNGTHDNEKASWLALPKGASTLGSLDAEAGDVSVDEVWVTVSFSRSFDSTPVVIPTVTTKNGGSAVVVRLRNVSSTGFELRLQEEEANDDNHAFETVHWVAIETGSTTANGSRIKVARTGNSVTDQAFLITAPSNMGDNPKFLAAAQTYDGTDPANVRFDSASVPLFNTFFAVIMDEETSNDAETSHNSENVGYIFID